MSSTKALFQPLQIGDVTVKNRIHMAALTRNRAKDTYPSDLIKEHYVQRASAGLIVTEAILVTRLGTEWPHAPGLWEDKHVEGWKSIVDAVHEAGSIIYAQLWHVGRVAHPDMEQQKLAGEPVYGPSAIGARGGKFRLLPGQPGYVTPTAIDDPWKIVALFKRAAVNAKKAGFDGVELHGANGYIIHQFLDSTSNQRTDEWGGSIENRARLALEIIKATQEVFGRNVAIKLSPAGGYNDMGMPLQETLDTYSYVITEADKLGVSYFALVRYALFFDVEYDGVRRATKHDVLASYSPYIKNAKVIVNSGVTPEEGEELVAAGKADAISIGFNYITHPDLVERVQHGKPLDNIPDMPHMQTNKDSGDWRTGYNDYPTAVY
ncbi:N-ethylmaleimide reductase [Psilocybe cubensis]|uniref:N-ethylmaleimide reductase n=2 Tax=Psilocybe cubensis TaxID=181762 RepID=A0ACB8GUQ0_PSICU|nr:N-ethylmaleimide reductase [Psilocybe cubensis]KAH9478744.1 N-ethylmaleimide reductase [Psilocybe cubensis]